MFSSKKVFKEVAVGIIALSMCVVANAQQKGDFSAGVNLLGGYGGNVTDFGPGVVLSYNITDPIRVAGEFDFLWGINDKSTSLVTLTSLWKEGSVYGHYLFPIGTGYLYPLVGAGIVEMTAKVKVLGITESATLSKPVFSLGVGATGVINEKFNYSPEVRLKIVEDSFRYQFMIGIAYKF